MGVDYAVYLGPYIQFKTKKKLTKKANYDKYACANAQCKKLNVPLTSDVQFCSACGDKIEPQSVGVDEEWYLYEFAEEMGINDEVYPDDQEDEGGDTQIWFPYIEKSKRDRSWDIKYNTVWEDLTDLDIKAEIQQVYDECAKALKVLEEAYGTKPEVRWGLISSISC